MLKYDDFYGSGLPLVMRLYRIAEVFLTNETRERAEYFGLPDVIGAVFDRRPGIDKWGFCADVLGVGIPVFHRLAGGFDKGLDLGEIDRDTPAFAAGRAIKTGNLVLLQNWVERGDPSPDRIQEEVTQWYEAVRKREEAKNLALYQKAVDVLVGAGFAARLDSIPTIVTNVTLTCVRVEDVALWFAPGGYGWKGDCERSLGIGIGGDVDVVAAYQKYLRFLREIETEVALIRGESTKVVRDGVEYADLRHLEPVDEHISYTRMVQDRCRIPSVRRYDTRDGVREYWTLGTKK